MRCVDQRPFLRLWHPHVILFPLVLLFCGTSTFASTTKTTNIIVIMDAIIVTTTTTITTTTTTTITSTIPLLSCHHSSHESP